MRTIMVLLTLAVLLSGCGAQPTFETISDDIPAAGTPAAQLNIPLLKEYSVPVVADDGSRLYLYDDHVISVQTFASSDLDITLRQLTGIGKDQLMLIQTSKNGIDMYNCAWCATGEGEDQICRAMILDDGEYHYAVTVMGEYQATSAVEEAWQQIYETVSLQY